MKQMRKIIEIDEELCNGCGQCVPDCAEGSLIIENGKARLVADKLCDGLGACLGSCPQGALKIVEKEVDIFDEQAVQLYLSQQKKTSSQGQTLCPSAAPQIFSVPLHQGPALHNEQSHEADQETSLLGQWPVQIRLIPATAPFLKNSDILIVADCTAVAIPDFQKRYLAGKVVMMGCPKFDNSADYVNRFAEIITVANVHSFTLLIVEVPCCSGMVGILKQAFEQAGQSVPVEQITISRQGFEIKRSSW